MRFIALLVLLASLACGVAAHAAEARLPLLEQIDRLATLDEDADPLPLLDEISDAIARDPATPVAPLLARIASGTLPEKQLSVAVWALGLTRDPRALEPILRAYRAAESSLVRGSCLQAVAAIGGPRAAETLLAAFDAARDSGMRFGILALLGQLQEPAALSRAEALLRLDPEKSAWQSVFVFAAMGDTAVPFLLSKIADPDVNVRTNAIAVLGIWLLAPEAGPALTRAYFGEASTQVRALILGSVQRTIADLGELRRFLERVVATEQEAQLLTFARETLTGLDGLAADAARFRSKRTEPTQPFGEVWGQLYRSAGRKGDYDALAAASTVGDEASLKLLRERILQRRSDDALQDYQKVNRIILRNRLAALIAAAPKP